VSQQDVVHNVGKGVVVGGAAVVVFMFVVFLAGLFGPNDAQESKDLRSERIKPLGQVNLVEKTGAVAQATVQKPVIQKTGPAKSGQEVYNTTCMACHATGIAGAPKYGDEAAWTPRIAKGEATLIQHALNGLNAMPPRGGNLDLSDEEIKGAVHYILKAVGGSSAEAATPAPSTATQPAAAPSKSGQEIYKSVCSTCHAIGIVGAPKFGDKDMWAPRIAKGNAALLNNALKGLNAMPPRGGNPNLSDDDVKAAIDYMLEAVSEKPAKTPIATSPAAAPSHDLARGEQVYQTACQACHAMGIVGAPKFGDKEAWKSRVAQDMETLFNHALNGFQGKTGVMPPKGGATNSSDADIKAAVAYMVSKVK
jgi:cytochrome c5